MIYEMIFVGINYKTPQETLKWVKSILNSFSDKTIILVVDNSYYENTSLEKELEKIDNVIYLIPGENLGYFNGANFALEYLNTNKYLFKWLMISNVDLELKTSDVLAQLKKYEHTNVGVIAPAIISTSSGIDKNPYRVKPYSKEHIYLKKILYSNFLFSSIYEILAKIKCNLKHHKIRMQSTMNSDKEIYLPYGACFIFSRRYFEGGGKIKMKTFLYGEEIFVAEWCRRLGLSVFYVPAIIIKNHEHASTSLLKEQQKRKMNYAVAKYILDEFFRGNYED